MSERRNRSIGVFLLLASIVYIGLWGVPMGEMSLSFRVVFVIVSVLLLLLYFIGRQAEKYKKLWAKVIRDKKKYETAFDNDFTFMWQLDETNEEITVTQGISSILGEEIDELTQSYERWKKRLCPGEFDEVMAYLNSLRQGESAHFELRMKDKQDHAKWIEVYGNPLYDEAGQIEKLIGTAIDITERKELEEQMQQAAYTDHLTGLPNRECFNLEFAERLKRCNADVLQMAIVYIDLDRFKVINETQGHDIGDKVLIRVALRLKELLGEEALISREGGDEFLLLIENVSKEEVEEKANEIIQAFKEPIKVGKEHFYLTPSLGISRYPESAQDIEALVQQAETAMYMVKNNGKNNYHTFVASDAAKIERKRRIEFELKEAIKRNELHLVYQPKVKLSTGAIYGAEALLRWNHPDLGFVSPGEFIPIAEESGLIHEIGYWVLYEALRQTSEWLDQGIELQISVNVSALQYEQPYFVERVKQTLNHHRVDAKYLILEITESVMQNIKHSARVIEELHDLGVSVAIDDFGTGYSSLSLLNNVLIDFVKIDKSFIDQVMEANSTASLVKTMIQMGKNMNFGIVAEGIETEDQVAFLRENSCAFGQGYYYAKPLAPEDIPASLTQKYAG